MGESNNGDTTDQVEAANSSRGGRENLSFELDEKYDVIEKDKSPSKELQEIELPSYDLKTATNEGHADYETAIAKTGFGKFNVFLLVLAFPATCSSTFDTASIPFVLPVASCDLDLSGLDRGLLNGAVYAGMMSSSFIWGYLSDTLGRHRLLALGYLLDAFFAITASFLQNKWAIFLLKYLSGCAIAGPFSMFITYISEMFGKKYRDSVILSSGIYSSIGGVVQPLIALAVIPKVITWELFGGAIVINSWRLFLILSAAPALTAGVMALFCVESPKFLLGKGRKDEAITVLRYMYAKNTGQPPDSYPVSSVFRHPFLKNTLLCCGVQFLALNSLNTIRLWLPLLFFYTQTAEEGMNTCEAIAKDYVPQPTDCASITVDESVYLQVMYTNFSTAVCMALSSYLVKSTGKKVLIVCCFSLSAVLVVCMPWVKATYIVWVACLYSGVIFAASISTIGLAVELFPTSVRTLAVSLTMTSGRTGVVLGSLMHPFLLALSCWTPFVTVGAFCIVSGTIVFLAAPGKNKADKLNHNLQVVA